MPTYVIATPPSVNNLFVNHGRNGGRVKSKAYKMWQRGELKALLAQRAKPIGALAKVSVMLPKKMRGDVDNRCKPVLDLLVQAGVLQDDSSKYVSGVSVAIGTGDFCHVSVEPV